MSPVYVKTKFMMKVMRICFVSITMENYSIYFIRGRQRPMCNDLFQK